MKIEKINHVGIVVRDLESSLQFWRDALGLPLDHIEEVPSHQVKVAFFPAGESELELVAEMGSPAPDGRMPPRRAGLDHLCLQLANLEEALVELKARGICLIDETPVTLPRRKIAFVDPRSADGVLLEFYELTKGG